MYRFHKLEQRTALYQELALLSAKIDQSYAIWSQINFEDADPLEVEAAFIHFLRSRYDLDVLWGEISLYDRVMHSKELRALHAQSLEELQKFSMKYLFDPDLYHSFEKALNVFEKHQKSYPRMSACAEVIHRFLKHMRQAGAHLSAEKKEELQKINLELSSLSQHFQQNVLDSEEHTIFEWPEESLKGLSVEQKKLLSINQENGLYQMNRTALCRQLVLDYVENRDLRAQYYRACITRCGPADICKNANNADITQTLLDLRLKKANILGYPSYQHEQLSDRLAQSPSEVDDFYKQFLDLLPNIARQEIDILQIYAKKQALIEDSLSHWDIAYCSRLQEESLLNITEQELKDYFGKDHVLAEFFKVFSELYGLSFEPVMTDPGSFWHEDVFCVAVYEQKNHTLLGYIYFDLFQRPLKMSGAWMDELSVSTDYQDWKNVAHILCISNFHEKEQWRSDEVQTLYHELGHCLHGLLSRHPLAPCSGISDVPWDIVELPSMLAEQWSKQPVFLKNLGQHKDTQEPLPQEWIEKIYSKERYGAARFLLRQALLGFYDWNAHNQNFHREETISSWREIGGKYWPLGVLESDCFPMTFCHIFSGGYSAGYYSYLWAEVYVHQVYAKMQALAEATSWSEAGMAFRKAFLNRGGDANLKKNLDDFLGEPLSVDYLLTYYGLEKSS